MSSERQSQEQFQELLEKRFRALDNMRRAHGSQIAWLNSVSANKKELDNIYWDENKSHNLNSVYFFYLGASIPLVSDQSKSSLTEYLKILVALMKEYETLNKSHSDTTSISKNKIVDVGRRIFKTRHKSNELETSSARPGSSIGIQPSTVPLGTQSLAANHDFVHLNIQHLPYVPDMYETFICLCDSLKAAFAKIHELSQIKMAVNAEATDLLGKFDSAVTKFVFNPTTKGISELSKSMLNDEAERVGRVLSLSN